MTDDADSIRTALATRGRRLEYFTLAWNLLEAVVGIAAGSHAGSIALLGFGFDSLNEMASGGAALWRIASDADPLSRERSERYAGRIIGICFVALAAFILYESVGDLIKKQAPDSSIAGVILACAATIAMPLLARAKERIGRQLSSRAMEADAKQSEFCGYLSAILLAGLLLNALCGFWWADPAAALVMAPIIANEGVKLLRNRNAGNR